VKNLKRYRWPIIGVVLAVAVVGFLAFRPDKLFVDDTVDEALSDAFAPQTTTPEDPRTTTTTTPDDADETSTTTTSTSIAATPTAAPSEPAAVTTGTFYGIDHSAEGTATVYEQDGRFVLRLEDNTDIQNGPDLYVWVLPSDDYAGGVPPEYLDLGKIKGNVGGQNYALPAEFDPEVHRTILVWCLRFSTPFTAAPLA
jgi:hypothetical protein